MLTFLLSEKKALSFLSGPLSFLSGIRFFPMELLLQHMTMPLCTVLSLSRLCTTHLQGNDGCWKLCEWQSLGGVQCNQPIGVKHGDLFTSLWHSCFSPSLHHTSHGFSTARHHRHLLGFVTFGPCSDSLDGLGSQNGCQGCHSLTL